MSAAWVMREADEGWAAGRGFQAEATEACKGCGTCKKQDKAQGTAEQEGSVTKGEL